ncbi:MAG: histidinol-phosphatase [Acidimicrobiia bacterium]|nr:histidinol-phosphatase [Acidimicrobiia bacterium]
MPGVEPDALAELLEEAVALARAAGDRTLRWFRAPDLVVDTKADLTPVTEADRDAERYLRAELGRRHPGDGILGEEEGELAGRSGRRWIIDPIDGTKAFTHGVPLYSTLLAVLDESGPLVGVVHLPALGQTVYAARGLGCWLDGQPARARSRPGLDGAWVMTSGLTAWTRARIEAVQSRGASIRTWGDAYGYSLVATGFADAMVDPEASLWDLAPMPVILAEAGGRFTTLEGAGGPEGGSGVGTAGGPLHDELLAALAC